VVADYQNHDAAVIHLTVPQTWIRAQDAERARSRNVYWDIDPQDCLQLDHGQKPLASRRKTLGKAHTSRQTAPTAETTEHAARHASKKILATVSPLRHGADGHHFSASGWLLIYAGLVQPSGTLGWQVLLLGRGRCGRLCW